MDLLTGKIKPMPIAELIVAVFVVVMIARYTKQLPDEKVHA